MSGRRLRLESDEAQKKLKDMRKTMVNLEAEKADLERRMLTSKSPGYDRVDHVVRSQIPLLSSPSSGGQSRDHGESIVKIRILEQENERFVRKIKGLESQLVDLERNHGVRIQELLSERRKDRDKDNVRHNDSLNKMKSALDSREKIYKERIKGLEQQVDVLKDQLAKETRRRQIFISGSSAIDHEVRDLRQNLDESLFNVSNVERSKFDGHLLDRESAKLSERVAEYSGRISTPSKILTSTPQGIRGAASVDNLLKASKKTYSMSTSNGGSGKRNLSFEQQH